MSDFLAIGPSRRRTDMVILEQSQFSDVRLYVDHLRNRVEGTGQSVEYPQGTLESAFIAANRNFGWFNVIMSSVHASYASHTGKGETTIEASQLMQEFARAEARAGYVFDLSPIKLIRGIEHVSRTVLDRLLYRQLPVEVGPDLPSEMAEQLLGAEVPGIGPAFAELIQVHLDEKTLASELVQPEIGFKPIGTGDTYRYYNCELSIGGLLAALRAFSVTAENGDLVAYTDLDQFNKQLATLYPRENIENATEPLHRIFTHPSYQVNGKRFIAISFSLLRQIDRLLTTETQPVTFFRDGRNDAKIDAYLREQVRSGKRRHQAICEGLAKVLDDSLTSANQVEPLEGFPHIAFTAGLVSPLLEGLQVTTNGRITIVYAVQPERLGRELAALLSMESVHPIVVLFGPNGDLATFQSSLAAFPEVERCVLSRRLTSFEEDFLVKYSGRGVIFNPNVELPSARTNGLLGNMRDDWRAFTQEWRKKIEESGYLLRPIWYKMQGLMTNIFYRGFRYMLAKGVTIDSLPDRAFTALDLEQIKQACRKNTEAPSGKPDCLRILDSDPYRPLVPACFYSLLRELKSQRTMSKLARSFFFATTEMQPDKQVQQVLDLLRALQLVTKSGDGYKAVNADILTQYREATSTWLTGECLSTIESFRDIFADQARKIEKTSFVFAQGQIAQAKDTAQAANFGVLTQADTNQEAFAGLVRQIAHFEKHLDEVCPENTYKRSGEVFSCSPAEIRSYQEKLEKLSLWHQVNFLKKWLREAFMNERHELITMAQIYFLKLNLWRVPAANLSRPLHSHSH